jgi:hypothetical protein
METPRSSAAADETWGSRPPISQIELRMLDLIFKVRLPIRTEE